MKRVALFLVTNLAVLVLLAAIACSVLEIADLPGNPIGNKFDPVELGEIQRQGAQATYSTMPPEVSVRIWDGCALYPWAAMIARETRRKKQ